MARPIKKGLDYFTVLTSGDKELDIITSKFGALGKGIAISLMEEIYGGEGYYCLMNEKNKFYFTARIGIDKKTFDEFLKFALELEYFNREMYELFDILTSKNIQCVYFSAVSRRKSIKVNNDYILIDFDKDIANDSFLLTDDDDTRIIVDTNSDNVCKSTQSKDKKSKEKHSTVQYSTPKNSTEEELMRYLTEEISDEADAVDTYICDKELSELVEEFEKVCSKKLNRFEAEALAGYVERFGKETVLKGIAYAKENKLHTYDDIIYQIRLASVKLKNIV